MEFQQRAGRQTGPIILGPGATEGSPAVARLLAELLGDGTVAIEEDDGDDEYVDVESGEEDMRDEEEEDDQDDDDEPNEDDSRIHIGASFFKSLDWTALAVPGIATRFLPNVGWCIRYGSRVSQGGRFRIMYLDGATMDIDVDEEWVELQQEGDVVR